MSEVSQDNSKQVLASEELIAQAYAAIASSGRHGAPPAPTGAPVAVQAPPSAKSAAATKSAPSRPAAAPTASQAPSLHQQAHTKPTAGPKVLPTGAPYHQPVREQGSSSPFQPPPPTGAPASPMSRPIAPSRHTVTTGPDSYNPSAQRPIKVDSVQQQPASHSGYGGQGPAPQRPASQGGQGSNQQTPAGQGSQRPAQQQPKKKQGSGITWFIWFLIIMFLIFILPNLQLLD